MSDEATLTVLRYRFIITYASLIILGLWVMALLGAYLFEAPVFFAFIIGGFIGSGLAVINVFALAYAAYFFFIKKTVSYFIFGPFISFGILVFGALFAAYYDSSSALGFALGLSSPLILGAAIVFFENSTAVQR